MASDEVPHVGIALASMRKEEVPYLAICFASIIAGILGMGTNNDFNMIDGSLILLGGGLVVLELKDRFSNQKIRGSVLVLLLLSMVLLATNGLRYGELRLRVNAVGPGAFFEEAGLNRLDSPPLFRGMYVGPRLVRVLDQMTGLLESYGYSGRPDAPVFFGPRIDFAYAAYGIHPYPGLPLWWEAFSNGRQIEAERMVQRFEKADFKLCVFLNWGGNTKEGRDYTFLPSELVQYLNQAYDVYDIGELTIHIKRK